MHRPIIKTRARIVKPPGTWLVGLSTFHLAQRTWCYDVIKAFFFTALFFGRFRGGLGPPGSRCRIMPADPVMRAGDSLTIHTDCMAVKMLPHAQGVAGDPRLKTDILAPFHKAPEWGV